MNLTRFAKLAGVPLTESVQNRLQELHIKDLDDNYYKKNLIKQGKEPITLPDGKDYVVSEDINHSWLAKGMYVMIANRPSDDKHYDYPEDKPFDPWKSLVYRVEGVKDINSNKIFDSVESILQHYKVTTLSELEKIETQKIKSNEELSMDNRFKLILTNIEPQYNNKPLDQITLFDGKWCLLSHRNPIKFKILRPANPNKVYEGKKNKNKRPTKKRAPEIDLTPQYNHLSGLTRDAFRDYQNYKQSYNTETSQSYHDYVFDAEERRERIRTNTAIMYDKEIQKLYFQWKSLKQNDSRKQEVFNQYKQKCMDQITWLKRQWWDSKKSNVNEAVDDSDHVIDIPNVGSYTIEQIKLDLHTKLVYLCTKIKQATTVSDWEKIIKYMCDPTTEQLVRSIISDLKNQKKK